MRKSKEIIETNKRKSGKKYGGKNVRKKRRKLGSLQCSPSALQGLELPLMLIGK